MFTDFFLIACQLYVDNLSIPVVLQFDNAYITLSSSTRGSCK